MVVFSAIGGGVSGSIISVGRIQSPTMSDAMYNGARNHPSLHPAAKDFPRR